MQEVPIVVAARVRPLLDQEKLHHEDQCISFVNDKPQLILGKNRGFKFDHVFTPEATQDQVYENCVKPLVKCCFDGYNATVFAYGQTGSGKTYTMGTGNSVGLLETEFGILPRAINEIFQIIQKRSGQVVFKVKVSFIEIYKEEARDLLEFEGSGKYLHIREDDKGNTVVTGLREESVHCLEDVNGCLDSGAALRHTASTRMNEYSSRSHCIFTIMIEQHPIASAESVERKIESEMSDGDTVIVSKFHFVDLAGSERAHRTGNQGERFRESVSINSGLLALGNVISALSDAKRRMQHVPYRQSKLTRLLKDSLGGNSRTAMITCLSPCSSDLDENLNSLKYATRAKSIRNKPIINTIIESTRLAHMENEIQVLKDELLRQRTIPAVSRDSNRSSESEKSKEFEEELERLKTQCDSFKEIGHQAASLIRLFHDADMPPYDVQDRISLWIKSWDALIRLPQGSKPAPLIFKKNQNNNVHKLQIELDKCKNELENDEEIFIEKTKELNELKGKLQELEKDKQDFELKIKHYMNSNRQKDKQLFEQQIRIQTFEDKLFQQYKDSDKKGDKVPRSAPETRRNPPLAKEEKIMMNFRARSAMLISRLEDLDEVSRDTHFSSDEDNLDSDNDRRPDDTQKTKQRAGLGSTFTKEMPLFTPPSSQDARARRRNRAQTSLATTFTQSKEPTGRASSTPSKLPVRKRSNAEAEAVLTARKNTAETRKKIRNAEFDTREAKQKMRDLESNIKQKEEHIKELFESDKEKEALNNQYKEKVQSLEKEIERSKKDLDESKKKLDNYEKQGTERQKLEKDYKRKLKNLEMKVSQLQKKQSDSMVVNAFKEKGERKLNDLEGQVERLRNQHDSVSKKLREETDRKGKLEQELARGEQKIKELELKTEQQQKLLKRKTEEVVAAHKKLRTGSNASDQNERNEFEEKKKNLDIEIERILKEKQEMEELEEELRKREDIIKKKEILLNEKCEIEMKKLRSSQILSKDVMRLSVQLDDVQKAIMDARSASAMMQDRAKFQEDIARLLRRKAELDQQCRNLENRLQEDDVLEPVEERRLAELTEAVDALDMAIEYKNEIIDEKEKSMNFAFDNRDEEIDQLLDNLGNLSQDENKALLRKYFERVIELKESERKTFDLKEEIEIELTEKDKVIQELQHCINQTEARAEKRLTEMDREYEKQIQFLMEKINEDERSKISQENVKMLEKRIHDLEKDLYYHKKTSRELKHKLREVTGASSVAISDSISSEKPPISSRISEKSRGSQSSVESDEKMSQNASKVSSTEQQMIRKGSNENFHFPPVQRVTQDDKKLKSDKKEGIKSPKSQRFDKHIAPDEQKRLKEIFEARQHSSKLKKDHKTSKTNQSSDSSKSAASNHHVSSQEESSDGGKNPWT